jgi:hypothetical protein
MTTPSAHEHAGRTPTVFNYIRNEPALQQHTAQDFDDYCINFFISARGVFLKSSMM